MITCGIDTKGLDTEAVITETKSLSFKPNLNVDASPPIEQVVNNECSSRTDIKVVIKLGLGECELGCVTNLDSDKRDMHLNMVPMTDMDKQVRLGSGTNMDNKDINLDMIHMTIYPLPPLHKSSITDPPSRITK